MGRFGSSEKQNYCGQYDENRDDLLLIDKFCHKKKLKKGPKPLWDKQKNSREKPAQLKYF